MHNDLQKKIQKIPTERKNKNAKNKVKVKKTTKIRIKSKII